MQILTCYRINPQPIAKTIVSGDYGGNVYSWAKFGENLSTEGIYANGWNITKFLFIY